MNILKQITSASLLVVMVAVGCATPTPAQAQSNSISHLPVEEQRAILLAQIRELIAILQQLQSRAQLEQATVAFDAGTQRLGEEDTVIEIETFIDYQSPFSKNFHQTLQQLVGEYDGDLSVQYRHFPLDQLHPEATDIAKLMVCVGHVGGQEDFVALSDFALLPDSVTGNNIRSYKAIYDQAAEMVASTQLNSCVDSTFAADVVRRDVDLGMKKGVQGVPMSYISVGSQSASLNGALPYDITKQVIENLLNQID